VRTPVTQICDLLQIKPYDRRNFKRILEKNYLTGFARPISAKMRLLSSKFFSRRASYDETAMLAACQQTTPSRLFRAVCIT
jgi:hypothetical protein